MSDPGEGDGKGKGGTGAAGKRRRPGARATAGIGKTVRGIAGAGQSMGRVLTESAMHHVHSSGEVHRMAVVMPREDRRKRVILRSVIVGFVLIFTWIGVMISLQLLGEKKGPDFRTQATAFFTALTEEDPALLYEETSSRFQETILKEKFIDDVREITRALGKFREIATVIDTESTRGPGGRAGHLTARLAFERDTTTGWVSFHFIDGQWRALGYAVDIPASLKAELGSNQASEIRAKAPPEIRPLVDGILLEDRAGQAGAIWDEAATGFQASIERKSFEELSARRREALGPYRRIVDVTRATLSRSQGSVEFIAVLEFGNGMTTGSFSFAKEDDRWKLTFYKLIIPQPRVPIGAEDDEE